MPTLVVAALSARQLAQSARRAGWNVVALDLFGDIDTRDAAAAWHSIGDADSLRIDGERFLAALASARAAADCFGWIAGAGFEPRLDLLAAGARVLPLIGNDPTTVRGVRDPRRFFAALAESGIPHPETRFAAPSEAGGWLQKDFASSGGWHIRHAARARQHDDTASTYFQRELAGRSMSMLFVASEGRAHAIGFNELIVRAHGVRPHIYHGALGPVSGLPRSLAAEVSSVAGQLAQRFGLCGLGSIDFLQHDQTFSVLEVNARPSSTMALYDAQVAGGLLKLHVDACAGTLPPELPDLGTMAVRGELTVFAAQPVDVTQEHVQGFFALGCRDVPQPATHIVSGAPLCSVCALGASADEVRANLAQHEAAVLAMVQNRNEAHHHAS